VDNVTLLDSLLDAIVRLDGDSLVMHVGEKPYVVTMSSALDSFRGPLSWGQVELSSRPLTPDAVLGMLGQILSDDQRRLLEDLGAIECELVSSASPGEPFIMTAARGGDDVWVEVRRKPKAIEPVVEEPIVLVEPVMAEAPAVEPVVLEEPVMAEAPVVEEPVVLEEPVMAEAPPVEEPIVLEEPVIAEAPVVEEPVVLEEPVMAEAPAVEEPVVLVEPVMAEAPAVDEPVVLVGPVMAEPPAVEEPIVLVGPVIAEAPPVEVRAVTDSAETHWPEDDRHEIDMPAGLRWMPADAHHETEPSIAMPAEEPAIELEASEPAIELARLEPIVEPGETQPAVEPRGRKPSVAVVTSDPAAGTADRRAPSWSDGEAAASAERDRPPIPAVVPIAKPPLKLQPPPPAAAAPAASTEASLVALLKAAAARGASTLYAVADSRPMIRVDGGIALLGVEGEVTGAEVDRFAFEFAPRDHIVEAAAEWTCAIKGVGRVRCVTFHDDSGAGLIVHLPSPDVSTADELGLGAREQALCGEADGLVVIAGPRGSGKSTLLDAFVDLINRTRNDHVITIESHIRSAHEKRHSFISQRQSEPDGGAIAAAARQALREGPDVLVIEDLRAPEALSVALDAARAGRLVFGGIAAPTASAAIERLIGAYSADRRPQVRALLAGSLRAVIAQVLVRKPNGGRAGAREILLNSPAVGKLILDGITAQLPIAIEGGRRIGMVTMNDALGALVRDGVVEAAEACRAAPDRAALLAALEQDGIDVSNVERRA
jgi:twitching motility protein PilT